MLGSIIIIDKHIVFPNRLTMIIQKETCYLCASFLMITIIAGTNRKGSMTLKVAKFYYKLIAQQVPHVHLLSLEELNVWERNPNLLKVMKRKR